MAKAHFMDPFMGHIGGDIKGVQELFLKNFLFIQILIVSGLVYPLTFVKGSSFYKEKIKIHDLHRPQV